MIVREVFVVLSLGLLCFSGLSAGLVVPVHAATSPGSGSTTATSDSSNSGKVLLGSELWENDSFPFGADAASSVILALPTFASWLSSHSIPISELRPYLTLWTPSENPYDQSQMTVAFSKNNTVYDVYTYILPNGTVIGVWVSEGTSTVVRKPYTFPSQGDVSNTGFTADNVHAAGHQAQDSNTNGTYPMLGAEYNTTVFSDLTKPSSCSTYCWLWSNWLGTSNYNWNSSTLPSHPFFL